ncbi:MAG: hypothetical protein J6L83_05600 [Clostridia bacterium]|nr:hypothetical protein [Clostridia bacterium]
MEEKDIGTLAAEKIAAQMKEATEKLKGEKGGGVAAARRAMKLVLIEEIGKMISKFCYQNDEFAEAVERYEKTILDVVEEVTKDVDQNNPSLSDVVAYMRAVKCYLSEAEVICSLRINIHKEIDDDLLDLESFAVPDEQSGAIILDLFGTGEV